MNYKDVPCEFKLFASEDLSMDGGIQDGTDSIILFNEQLTGNE